MKCRVIKILTQFHSALLFSERVGFTLQAGPLQVLTAVTTKPVHSASKSDAKVLLAVLCPGTANPRPAQ